MKNQDIRNEVRAAGLMLWQIAEQMNIADYNLSRKLRHELSDMEKADIRRIIQELKEEEKQ